MCVCVLKPLRTRSDLEWIPKGWSETQNWESLWTVAVLLWPTVVIGCSTCSDITPVKLAGLKVWKCATECTRALMITVRYLCFMVQLSIKDLRLVVACNSLLNVRVTMLYARRYSTLDSRSRIISLALSSLFSKFTSQLHHGKQWYIYVNCKLIFLFR